LAHSQGGTRATFTNNGTFSKSAGSTGATEIQATFANGGTVSVGAGTLKLSGGGNSSNAVSVDNGAKLQIASSNFDFTGGTLNTTGTGVIEINSAVASFAGTTGNANLAVNGSGTARLNGNHTTSGKLTLAAGVIDGAGAADVGSLDWTGGNVNAKVKSNGAATISGGSSKVIST